VAKAMSGDLRAASLLFAHCAGFTDQAQREPEYSAADDSLHAGDAKKADAADAEQVAEFLNRRLKQLPPPPSSEKKS